MARKRTRINTQPEIRKLKRGWAVRYRIPAHDGEPESKSKWRKCPDAKSKGEARREAEEYRQELEDEINDYTTRENITLGEYAQRWHEDRKDNGELNELSWERENPQIRQIQATKLAKIPLDEITEEDIETFKRELSKESKSKQSKLLKKVKTILKHAAKNRRIPYSPAEQVKDVKAERKPRRSLPIDKQRELMKALYEEEQDGRHAAIVIAMATGLRRGEILGLQWKHFNPTTQTLTIEQQLNAKRKIEPPKNGSAGIVPLDNYTTDYLQSWKRTATATAHAKNSGEIPICCNTKFEYYNPANFDRWRRQYFVEHGLGTFEKVEKTHDQKGDTRYHRTGYQGYNLHELRHTAATELLGSGTDLQTVKTILRHKRLTTTEQYLHDIPENLSDAARSLAKRRWNPDPAEQKKRTPGAHRKAVYVNDGKPAATKAKSEKKQAHQEQKKHSDLNGYSPGYLNN